MVLMEPESSLLLSSPLTLLTDPLLLQSELEAAREFFLFTADDDALPFRLLLWWWCLLAALGTDPPPIMTISSESSTADAIRLNVFVRSFTLIFSSTGGGPDEEATEVMDCGSWLDPRDSSVVV